MRNAGDGHKQDSNRNPPGYQTPPFLAVSAMLGEAIEHAGALRDQPPQQSDLQALHAVGAMLGVTRPHQIRLLEQILRTTSANAAIEILRGCQQTFRAAQEPMGPQDIEDFREGLTAMTIDQLNEFGELIVEVIRSKQNDETPERSAAPGFSGQTLKLSYLSEEITIGAAQSSQKGTPIAQFPDDHARMTAPAGEGRGIHIIVVSSDDQMLAAGEIAPNRLAVRYGHSLQGVQLASAVRAAAPETDAQTEYCYSTLSPKLPWGAGINLYAPTPWENSDVAPTSMVICWDPLGVEQASRAYPRAWVTLFGGEFSNAQLDALQDLRCWNLPTTPGQRAYLGKVEVASGLRCQQASPDAGKATARKKHLVGADD